MKKLLLLCMVLVSACGWAQEVYTLFDFRHKQLNDWKGNAMIAKLEAREEGLYAKSDGREDPWIEGPAFPQMPDGDYEKVLVEIRFKGTASGIQMFYGPRFVGGKSVIFDNPKPGTWQTQGAILPRFEHGAKLRIDPCSYEGNIIVSTITARPLRKLYTPTFAKPAGIADATEELRAGTLLLKHHAQTWDAFTISNAGELLAQSYDKPQFTALVDGQAIEVALADLPSTLARTADGLEMTVSFKTGPIGWTAQRVFKTLPDNGIQITTSFTPDAEAKVLHVPFVTLFPGLGTSYGEHKTQGLFAGVEYLLDEPSSNELDVTGPTADRRFIKNYKTCFPLMALTFKEQWLALSWDFDRQPGMLFDSPDRQFKSDGHVFALFMPGTSQGRLENDFGVYEPMVVRKGEPLTLSAVVSAGKGDGTMAVPVSDYLRRHPLPPLPVYDGGYQAALTLAAQGWLDSVIRTDFSWRHAWVPNDHYGSSQKGDVLVMLDYIASKTNDASLAQRIRKVLEGTNAVFDKKYRGASSSHNWPNIYAFMYFNESENWYQGMRHGAMNQLKTLREDGSKPFVANPQKIDYGSTHWTDHANGLTATQLQAAAGYAQATGDAEYRKAYLAAVDKVLACYKNDVPRGAQTWEIPLHAPDLVGSAYMINLAVAAWRISGKDTYLKEAEYWALTGVPFVYLVTPKPTVSDHGLYSTIAVLGSTFFNAHMWVGNPVQWCGAVYRNSLYQFADELTDETKKAFWRQLADGITITGLRLSWQERYGDDKRFCGLLPDGWYPESLSKSCPAVNPGTILLTMPLAYQETPIGISKKLSTGVIITALGDVKPVNASAVNLSLWPHQTTQVLVSGLIRKPTCRWQGQPLECTWLTDERVAVFSLSGEGLLEWNDK